MELATVDTLIYKYTHKCTVKYTRGVRTIMLVFFLMSICILTSSKHFVVAGVLALFALGVYVYLTATIRKNNLTIYNGVCVGLILFCTLVVYFNVMIYVVQTYIVSTDVVPLLVVLFIEVLFLFAGFLYTLKCVDNGVVKESKNVIAGASLYYVFGGMGYYLVKNIFSETTVRFQNLFFTVFFAMAGSVMMFYIGLSYLSIIYFIKKYKITDRLINTGDGSLR